MIIFISMSIGYLMLSVLIFWQIIGVLRSSINHIKNPNKLSVWGYLAILMILGGVLKNYEVYKTSLVPQFISLYKIAILSDPDIPQYEITVVENGRELLIKGGIKYGLVKEVKKTLSQVPSVTTINFDSIGGRHGEAADLYNLISQRGLNTVTNTECLSACTIAYAAGKNRWIAITGQLGFHSSSFEGVSDNDANQALNPIFNKIHKEKKIPIGFLKKANQTPPQSMWYPTRDELYNSNYITSHFSPAISSLRILEKTLNRNLNKTISSLPKKLDRNTTLVDIRIKFNNVTSIHTISRDFISRIQRLGIGWQWVKKNLIKRKCKSEAFRRDIKIGIIHKYVYLHPKTKSNIMTFSSPKTCP